MFKIFFSTKSKRQIKRYRILYVVDKQREEVLIVKIEKRSETTYGIK